MNILTKKTLIYRFRGNGIHKTRKAYTMQTCSSLSINRHVRMDTRHLQSCHSKSCISFSSTLTLFYYLIVKLSIDQTYFVWIFQVRISQDTEHFLLNPFGMLYNEITASSLVKVDMQGNVVEAGTTNFGVNVAGFMLHSAIHSARPDIKCIIHVHTPAIVAVSSTYIYNYTSFL